MLNDRIRKLRKVLDLTQQEFADRLGVKRNTVATYEVGRSEPIDAVFSLICREFNVNEEWLRTGEGEMFRLTEESAVVRLCEELRASDLEAGIIRAYFRIDPKIRDTFMRRLLEEVQTEYPTIVSVDQDAIWEAEARAEAEEYYRQLLAEKERAAKSQVLPDGTGSDTPKMA